MSKAKLYIIVLTFSIIFFCYATYNLASVLNVKTNLAYTTGTILEIDTNNVAKIEYVMNEETLVTQQIVIGMAVNDEVTLIYDQRNPNVFIQEPKITKPLTLSIISILVFVYCLNLSNKIIKEQNRIKKLLKQGIYIEANIVDLYVNNKAKSKKGRFPYRARCTYINPSNQMPFNFESDDIYLDLNEIIKKYNITKLPVYVDKNNYNSYYIELSHVQKLGKK